MIAGNQLAFDLDVADDQGDLLAKVRAAVTEPGMSPEEIDGAVRDALEVMGATSAARTMPSTCACTAAMVFVDAFAEDRRCARCGREPQR